MYHSKNRTPYNEDKPWQPQGITTVSNPRHPMNMYYMAERQIGQIRNPKPYKRRARDVCKQT